MPKDFILPVTSEEYKQAGSKFVTIPPGQNEVLLDIEVGMLDWETPGKSLRIPITVTEEGPDYGKADKLVFGVVQYGDKTGVWKGKEAYRNIAGKEPDMKMASDGKLHPVFDAEAILGKPATGHWQVTQGRKGGSPDGDIVYFPKLIGILPSRNPEVQVYSVPAPASVVTPVGLEPTGIAGPDNVLLGAVIGATED